MLKSLLGKTEHLNNLYDKVKKYAKEISSFNKFECYKYVDEELITIPELFSKIKSLSDSSKKNEINCIFEVYHLIELIAYKIDEIIEEFNKIFNISPRDLIYDISETRMNSIHKLYDKIVKQHLLYVKNTKKNLFTETDLPQKHDLKDAKLYTDLVLIYPFSINLYVILIQKILNMHTKTEFDKISQIIEMVENVKDNIILNGLQNKVNKTIGKNNPHIKTFGLTPTGSSHPLNEITAIFSKSVKTEKNLGDLADDNNICICVFNRVISKPIEFSLWNLIDFKLSKDFILSEYAGVNNKMIEKFKMLSYASKKTEKWDFTIDKYGDVSSEYFVIIEKLGSNLYRLMHLYNPLLEGRPFNNFKSGGNFKLGGGNYETKIHRSRVSEFIEYIKGSNEKTRVSEYHNIQQREILKNVFMPTKFDMNSINDKSRVVDSKFLKNEMITELNREFLDIIKTEFKDGDTILTIKDVAAAIHNKRLLNTFSRVIIENYDSKSTSPFPMSESIKTFISYLGILNRKFVRDMHTKFSSIKMDKMDKMGTDNKSKKIYLTNLFNSIIESVLEKLINNDTNIYQTILYKNSMLKLSVV